LESGAEGGRASEIKSLHATERNTESNLKRREHFVAKIRTVARRNFL
jgi:hypothetical protein